MPERQESGKTSHQQGRKPNMSEFHGGPQGQPNQGPRFQVRPSARPGGYYWEAFDTHAPQNQVMPPTPNQQAAQARADQLNGLVKPPKKHRTRNILIGAAAGLVVILGAAGVGGAGDDAGTPAVTQPVDNGPTPDPITTPTNQPTTAKPTKEAHSIPPKPTATKPALTASQEQAIGSAQDYLDYSAFSRKGLIKQLSSEYGEGFSVKDATFAVDYLKVNWNEQAAKKAKEYLSMQHFSRKGLIQQLESEYGEQFTHSQAVYGVTKAGL